MAAEDANSNYARKARIREQKAASQAQSKREAHAALQQRRAI